MTWPVTLYAKSVPLSTSLIGATLKPNSLRQDGTPCNPQEQSTKKSGSSILLCEPLLAHELDERGAELRGRRRHLHAGGGQCGDLRVGRALKL